jgi:hypothetical protein
VRPAARILDRLANPLFDPEFQSQVEEGLARLRALDGDPDDAHFEELFDDCEDELAWDYGYPGPYAFWWGGMYGCNAFDEVQQALEKRTRRRLRRRA